MKKRFISVILFLCMICQLCSASGEALEVKVSGVECRVFYSVLGDDTVSIDEFRITRPDQITEKQWESRRKKVKKYRIPDTIDGRKVTRIGDRAFASLDSIQSIELPDGITEIGEYAFAWCMSVKSMKLPEGIRRFGYHAFFGMNALQKINIPDSLERADGNPFTGSISAKVSISREHPNFEIRDHALIHKGKGSMVSYLGNDLKEYSIPEGIVAIEDGAFMCNESLTELKFPDTVKKIGKEEFESCSGLAAVELPESLEEIGDGAFSYCNALKYLYLPASLSALGVNPFRGIWNLRIEVSPGNRKIRVEENALFTLENHRLVSYLNQGDRESRRSGEKDMVYHVPDGIRVIGKRAFCSDDMLTGIVFPKSVNRLESNAVFGLTELRKITFLGEITDYQEDSVYGVPKLEEIEVPEGTPEYGFAGSLRP